MCAVSSLAILVVVALAHSPAVAADKPSWHGFDRRDFVMDEQTLAIKTLETTTDDETVGDGRPRCILVVPKKPAPGNPWSWSDLHRDHRPPAEAELLSRGFHVAFITPGAPRQREAWLAFLTEKHRGTWPGYVPDVKSAAQGGYGADQSGRMIEVGSGEAVINKHLENMYRLTGLMREQPGPVGFKADPRYRVTPVPRDK